MARDPDFVDYVAAGAFGVSAVATGMAGLLMMVSLVSLPVGILMFIAAVLLWYAGKGVFSREGEAWWTGVVVVGLLTVAAPVGSGVLVFLGSGPSLLVGVALLTYLLVRRERYGIGVRRDTGYRPLPPREKEDSPGVP